MIYEKRNAGNICICGFLSKIDSDGKDLGRYMLTLVQEGEVLIKSPKERLPAEVYIDVR